MVFRLKTFIQLTMQSLLGLTLLSASLAFAENKTILVFGDSLSAAYGMQQSQGWASLLQQRLDAKSIPYQVVNASVSGETTSGGLARFPAALESTKPAIVMIELGANDGLRGLRMKAMKKNLQTMITQAKAIQAKVLLVGMRIPPNYGIRYTKSFANTYQSLSEENDIALVPFMMKDVSEKSELMQADRLHPNAKGQSMILDNIWPSLSGLLK
jgi:acyl-CoA thioesterase-1